MDNSKYMDFLKSKMAIAKDTGFEIDTSELNPALLPHQRDIIQWAIRGGRRAVFAQFGLGKTVIQLEFCKQVTKHKGGKALIVCPLGVKQEFVHDAVELLGYDKPQYVKTIAEVRECSTDILITNYERVRDGDIDVKCFTATSLDEAAVLRSFGSKTYQEFLKKFAGVPYKMVATATPDPNKYKELMGDPYVREGLLFDSESLNYYNGTLPGGDCDVKSAVDVAFGGGDSLSAPIIYWFGNVGYVHDWVFSDKDKTVTEPLVVDRFIANDVSRSRFEANAGGRAYAEDIERQLKERGHHCSVTTSSANVRESKDGKILRYSTDIRDCLVFRNDANRGAMYDKAMAELCRYSVNTSGKKIKRHDDAADSLAMNIDFHQNGLCTVEIIENKFL